MTITFFVGVYIAVAVLSSLATGLRGRRYGPADGLAVVFWPLVGLAGTLCLVGAAAYAVLFSLPVRIGAWLRGIQW